MKTFVIGAIAIVVVGIAVVAGIYFATSGPTAIRDPGPPPVAEALPPPPPLPVLPPQGGTVNPFAGAPQATTAPAATLPARIEAPEGTWESIAIAPRPNALGPLGGAVGRGLGGLQPQLAACLDEPDPAGRERPTVVLDSEPVQDVGATVLVLQLVASGMRVRIEDAPLQTRGDAGDGAILCAQRLLRGRSFEIMGGAPVSGRYRMLYQLTR